MYRLAPGVKQDPHRRWALPDRVFFASGACHVLAFAFLQREAARRTEHGCRPIWIKPAAGFTGNHIFVAGPGFVFDYHGYRDRDRLLAHTWAKARRWWPGWDATVIELPPEVLASERLSLGWPGLHLREPGQFLHDAMPRARQFLARFPPADER